MPNPVLVVVGGGTYELSCCRGTDGSKYPLAVEGDNAFVALGETCS